MSSSPCACRSLTKRWWRTGYIRTRKWKRTLLLYGHSQQCLSGVRLLPSGSSATSVTWQYHGRMGFALSYPWLLTAPHCSLLGWHRLHAAEGGMWSRNYSTTSLLSLLGIFGCGDSKCLAQKGEKGLWEQRGAGWLVSAAVPVQSIHQTPFPASQLQPLAGSSELPPLHINLRQASCVHFPSTSCFLATSLFSKLNPFNGLKRTVLNVPLCHAV